MLLCGLVLVVPLVLAGTAVAGAGGKAKAHHSVADKKKKKPSVSVKPSKDLTDGQEVTVSGKYHPKNLQLGVVECADKGDQTGADDCYLEGIVTAKSDKKGTVKGAKFKVKLGPFGKNNIVCSDPNTAPKGCLISLGPLAPSGDHPTQPITFKS
jgi:hypothetical protein